MYDLMQLSHQYNVLKV